MEIYLESEDKMKTKKNKIAFPVHPGVFGENIINYEGMLLRDYFAAKAMQSLMPILRHDSNNDMSTRIEAVCEMAYRYADAMLKAGK